MEVKLIKKTDIPYGLDSLAALSYSAAAAADLSAGEKRKLLFSLYCLRCLFDNADLIDPPALLLQHGCCFLLPPSAHPQYQSQTDFFASALKQTDPVSVAGGGLIITHHGSKKLKFDAGSPLFLHFSQNGQIPAEFAEYPQKFEIFQAIDLLLAQESSTAELKSLWLLLLPFLLEDAPDDGDLLGNIAQKLNTEEVYFAAYSSGFESIIPSDPSEAFINQNFFLRWFSGYEKWRENNVQPPQQKIYSLPPFAENSQDEDNSSLDQSSDQPIGGFYMDNEKIAQNAEILLDAERLYAQTPDNEDALLLLLAARTNQPLHNQSAAQLADNVRLISQHLPAAKDKPVLAYYLGLSFLGLRQIDKARRAFQLCLKLKPGYAPAAEMLSALGDDDSPN